MMETERIVMDEIKATCYKRRLQLRSLSSLHTSCRSPLSPVSLYFTPGQKPPKTDRYGPDSDHCTNVKTPSDHQLNIPFIRDPLKSPRRRLTQCVKVDTPDRVAMLANGKLPSDGAAVLGRGSFGTVFCGKYHGQDVAVKLLTHPDESPVSPLTIDGESNARFLDHPNVVKIFAIDSRIDRGIAVVVMEDGGQTLQHIIDSTTEELTTSVCVDYARQIANGLAYIHSKDVLHLDIKPANILVNKDRICKISDFGCSVCTIALERAPSMKPRGTVAYCSPEIFRGWKPSDRSDIYSFGILLWQLKSRQTPYRGVSKERIIYMVVAQEVRPHSRCEGLESESGEYFELYLHCVQASPLLRPSADEVVKMLEAMA